MTKTAVKFLSPLPPKGTWTSQIAVVFPQRKRANPSLFFLGGGGGGCCEACWFLLMIKQRHMSLLVKINHSFITSTGKPWTLHYFAQHLLTRLLIFPTFLNGCRCNKETLTRIREAGFRTVEAEKQWVKGSSEAFLGSWNTVLLARSLLALINPMTAGFAEKWKK